MGDKGASSLLFFRAVGIAFTVSYKLQCSSLAWETREEQLHDET